MNFLSSIRNYLILAAVCLSVGFGAGWKTHAWKVGSAENEARKGAQKVADKTDVDESNRIANSEEVSSDISNTIRNSRLNTPLNPVFACMWQEVRQRRATAKCVQDPVQQPATGVQIPYRPH